VEEEEEEEEGGTHTIPLLRHLFCHHVQAAASLAMHCCRPRPVETLKA
jgi:hypothetical protein